MQKSSPVGMMLDFAYGRGTADGRPSAGKPDQAGATGSANMAVPVVALAAASRAWWESRRPPGWTLEQHLADPTAGCDGTAQERALAEAVAHWVGQDG
jgi:hypothetical protein